MTLLVKHECVNALKVTYNSVCTPTFNFRLVYSTTICVRLAERCDEMCAISARSL